MYLSHQKQALFVLIYVKCEPTSEAYRIMEAIQDYVSFVAFCILRQRHLRWLVYVVICFYSRQ